MRTIIAVGLLGGLAGAAALASLTLLLRHARTEDSGKATRGKPTIGASLDLGERLWHSSCPVDEIDGACIELAPTAEPRSGLPSRCAAGSARHWIVVPRDPYKQAAALAAFADVIDRLGAWAPTNRELRYDLGLARLYQGDALREAALAIAAPNGLDFDPARHEQDSRLQFDAWLKARTAARDRAAAKYAEVIAANEPKTMIAAYARRAQLAEDVADQLFTLDIPSSVRTGELAEDRVDAYCDAVIAVAEPTLTAAIDNYVACFAKATELGWFSEWSTLCETALERLRPAQYPTLSELRRRPELDPPTCGATADNYATGLDHARHGELDDALQSFEAAIADDPSSVMPWIDAGLVTLHFRKYDVAKQLFAKAIELAPNNYDALIGLGIARRGLGDLDGAEAAYERARGVDPIRGDAYYDLGILYKDFRSMAETDPDPVVGLRRSQDMYERARERFVQFLDKAGGPAEQVDAANEIDGCDRAQKQIDTFLAERGK